MAETVTYMQFRPVRMVYVELDFSSAGLSPVPSGSSSEYEVDLPEATTDMMPLLFHPRQSNDKIPDNVWIIEYKINAPNKFRFTIKNDRGGDWIVYDRWNLVLFQAENYGEPEAVNNIEYT